MMINGHIISLKRYGKEVTFPNQHIQEKVF